MIEKEIMLGGNEGRRKDLHADPVGRRMTGSACSGVPLGRSGADRFMNAKIKNLGGGFGGGMGSGSAN